LNNDALNFIEKTKKLLEKYPKTRKCPFCGSTSYLETIGFIVSDVGRYFCPECKFSFQADLDDDEIIKKAIEYYNRLEKNYENYVQMAKYNKHLMNKASDELKSYLLAKRL